MDQNQEEGPTEDEFYVDEWEGIDGDEEDDVDDGQTVQRPIKNCAGSQWKRVLRTNERTTRSPLWECASVPTFRGLSPAAPFESDLKQRLSQIGTWFVRQDMSCHVGRDWPLIWYLPMQP